MNIINELSEFYKHSMNVAGNVRNLQTTKGSTDLWIGWMRCYFSPYLKNNKVIFEASDRFSEYIDAVKFTVQDYKEYISCISKKNNQEAQNKLDFILQGLNSLDNQQLINLIEREADKFPTEDDFNNEWIIEENFNNMCKK